MRVVTPKHMRDIDRIAMERYGIPGAVLMENAGRALAKEAIRLIEGDRPKPVVLVAGKGNNGGDVMVAARHLFNYGLPVDVFLLNRLSDMKGDAKLNADILIKMGIPIVELFPETDLAPLKAALNRGGVIIDGIFGTGFRGKTSGIIHEAIGIINESDHPVISADIPSGIDGETGEVCGACVKATATVTFGFPKVGLLQYPGAGYVGHLIVADISIPRNIVIEPDLDITLLTGEFLSEIIPDRKPDAHKGSCGKMVVMGGSEGMSGAVVLCSLGGIKSGAGLVKTGLPGALNYVLENRVTEAISVPLGKGMGLSLRADGVKDKLTEVLAWADVVALGPGMGVNDDAMKFLEYVLAEVRVPLVLDADALNCIARNIKLLDGISVPVIMTPHPGEMARLTGIKTDEVQRDRINTAKAFAEEWGAITILKGANSVIAHPAGNIYINTSGNPGMASGGMGDVLTGIIASFIAQGATPIKAACAAVYVHGRAGDILAEERGIHGICATDLADYIPRAIKDVRENRGKRLVQRVINSP